MNRSIRCHLLATSAFALLAGGPLLAGPINPPGGPVVSSYKTLTEVEPRTAISATNTPGDADSSFKITQPGSYYLTGNITGVAAKHGIEIAASNVTLDLNGFTLQGVAGSLGGVSITATGLRNVALVNGTIRGWGQNGANMGSPALDGCRFADLLLSDNAFGGISAGDAADVSHCVVSGNGGGIAAGVSSSITDCTVFASTLGGGISVSTGSTIARCTATSNAGDGINAGSGCTITACTAQTNGGDGIVATNGATISNCTLRFNTGDGISVLHDCLILANTCESNGFSTGSGAGIHTVGFRNRVEGNLCVSADRGVQTDLNGNIILRNSCSANTINWVIAANNYYGPIIDRTAAVTAAVSGPAAAGTLATTDPNANFSF